MVFSKASVFQVVNYHLPDCSVLNRGQKNLPSQVSWRLCDYTFSCRSIPERLLPLCLHPCHSVANLFFFSLCAFFNLPLLHILLSCQEPVRQSPATVRDCSIIRVSTARWWITLMTVLIWVFVGLDCCWLAQSAVLELIASLKMQWLECDQRDLVCELVSLSPESLRIGDEPSTGMRDLRRQVFFSSSSLLMLVLFLGWDSVYCYGFCILLLLRFFSWSL